MAIGSWKGEAIARRGGLPRWFQRRLDHAAAGLFLARRAHRLDAAPGRHPRQAPGHGARRLFEAASRRAHPVARHPGHLERRPDRRDMAEMAGRVPDDHDRLRLPLGRHRAEGLSGGMAQFIIRRTFYALITLLILSFTIFTVVRLTGDPVTLLAEPGARAEDLDRVRAQWGLDQPFPVQYLSFLKNIATGELGKSFNYEMPVSTLYF